MFRENLKMMNNTRPPMPMQDIELIDEALASLQDFAGIEGKLNRETHAGDGAVSLQIAGTRLDYTCEIKRNVDRIAVLDDIKARANVGKATLLVSNPLTTALSARCRELGLQFIDTAGNAFITNGHGILISIAGRKAAKGTAMVDKAITPAALRMMFAFLAQPSMLNAPYREISSAVKVSTGAIGSALQALEARGILGTTPGGRRIINSAELMLSEWATGYTSRLRPKLKKFRFSAADPAELMEQWQPEMRISALGGEVAAEKLTQHLKPSTVTIYMEMDNTRELGALVKRFALRADPHGPIEIVQAFWNMDYFADSFPTVPLHLVYADLLGTNDSRNLLIARQIYKEVISHVHRSES